MEMTTETTTDSTATALPLTVATLTAQEKKDAMLEGNAAILNALSTEATKSIGKKEILAALSDELRNTVDQNWNLRIQYLEAAGYVESHGNKVAKKYWRV
jgi:hypothetical protein